MMNKHCQSRQHSDQMICHKCGLVWDMNDTDPPQCVHLVNKKQQRAEAALKQAYEIMGNNQERK